MSTTESSAPRLLDEGLYKLAEPDYEFMSAQTGIKDPEELKQHIIAVQKEIYAVCNYSQPMLPRKGVLMDPE